MRTEHEIARAHDILASVLMGRPPLVLDAEERLAMSKLYEALCWALNHDSPANRNVQNAISEIEKIAADHGWIRDEAPKIAYDHSRN